jgi:predicted HAD superfamily Cof-like phosphohydrolase
MNTNKHVSLETSSIDGASFQAIIACVREFHDRFGIPNAPSLQAVLPQKTVELRHRLMAEETEEYLEAAMAGDAVEIADALGDQLYILCGTILSHGMSHIIEDVFMEIQASNLSKLGADGKPIYREDGNVMKWDNYFKPRIADVLNSTESRPKK